MSNPIVEALTAAVDELADTEGHVGAYLWEKHGLDGVVAAARAAIPAVESLVAENARLREQKDGAYSERNQTVIALAHMARVVEARTEPPHEAFMKEQHQEEMNDAE